MCIYIYTISFVLSNVAIKLLIYLQKKFKKREREACIGLKISLLQSQFTALNFYFYKLQVTTIPIYNTNIYS